MLGFGCMRLPMIGDQVDIPQFCKMVDRYMAAGFNYFDTAHGYIDGKSETALRDGLTSRYPRESYILTNKLSGNFFSSRAEIAPLLEEQLTRCGVSYFDYYLMHAMNAGKFRKYTELGAFDEVLRLKAEGKIRHMGISFHDNAEALDMILTEQPAIEIVQIQFNYRDYEDPTVQSRACYEVCRKHGKPILVMEPVRGGNLVDLPEEAKDVLRGLNGGSIASYALRYAASFEGIQKVLSGMSSEAQMEDNLATMKDVKPLNDAEMAAIAKVVEILRDQDQIPCTRCQYCTERCPKNINIPRLFSIENTKREFKNAQVAWDFQMAIKGRGKPSDCVGCGLCEKACPQFIGIRGLLKEIAATYET